MISQAGYLTFLRTVVGIPVSAMPDDSPDVAASYDWAVALTPYQIKTLSDLMYTTAVYNCGADYLLQWGSDQYGTAGSTFFADVRQTYGINSFTAGVVEMTEDETTNAKLRVPTNFNDLTLDQLVSTKTPYGRQYLSIYQKLGSIWTLS